MTPERHQRATRIFLEACDLHGSARLALLERRCGDDIELRQHVEKMLAHDGLDLPVPAPALWLGSSAGPPAQALHAGAEPDPGVRTPETIGAYRIIDRLGEGGMGVVYPAG